MLSESAPLADPWHVPMLAMELIAARNIDLYLAANLDEQEELEDEIAESVWALVGTERTA